MKGAPAMMLSLTPGRLTGGARLADNLLTFPAAGGGVSIVGIVLMVAAFLVLRWKKWNPILVMLLCGIGGAAAHAVGWL